MAKAKRSSWARTPEADRDAAVKGLGATSVTKAKEILRKLFAENGFDYYQLAVTLRTHHYTLRRWARALDMTKVLVADRAKAITAGVRMNPFGRPKKPVPSVTAIRLTLAKCKNRVDDAAKRFKVTPPTFRTWCEKLNIDLARAS